MPSPRLYDAILAEHLRKNRQMAFVSGPRQVGKTTTCRDLAQVYMDWDNPDHRRIILAGPGAVASHLGLKDQDTLVRVVFDEFHKYGLWKGYLKGFFDTYEKQVRILVTGSSRLDVYRKGGDSLMGRYFLYRMHPYSIGEILRQEVPREPIRPPLPVPDAEFKALWEHGGFPEPFHRRDTIFTTPWKIRRRDQLLKEDIRELTRVQELGQMETLGHLLSERSSSQLVYSNLATEIGCGIDTVRRWILILSSLHLGFVVRPWFTNVSRALRKEPKWFLRDWSGISDPGARTETFVACHLLKAVEGWTDMGLGEFDLRYLRDLERREVDFVVIRDRKPWFLVEVKQGETKLSPSLEHFQRQTKAPHAFQAVLEMAHVDADCFERHDPVVVPARTLLSQLL